MIYIFSNIHILLIFYYFIIHKHNIIDNEVNKKIRSKVEIGEICYSCHEKFPNEHKYQFRFGLLICKSCERHGKLISLEKPLLMNKIKLRTFLLMKKKEILIYSIILSIIFTISSIIFNIIWFNLFTAIPWIYFIINDYLLIKPVKLK
jgi:hypothetical protein